MPGLSEMPKFIHCQGPGILPGLREAWLGARVELVLAGREWNWETGRTASKAEAKTEKQSDGPTQVQVGGLGDLERLERHCQASGT